MAKIKLHNPELATNSKFSNLVIEGLVTDPTGLALNSVGRIWFNETDKVFKGSFLNADGTAAEIKQIGIDNSALVQANADAIAQEIVDRIGADTLLQSKIDATNTALVAETTRANDADAVLQSKIDATNTALVTETTRATTAETTLQTNIDTTNTALVAETTRATTAETTLQTSISAETTRATTAETTLQSNISTLNTDLTTNFLNKTSATAQVVMADTTFNAGLVIKGDLTVEGTQTIINTEILKVADNIITLNSGIGNVIPTADAGLEVDRGNLGISTIIQWNETLDQVEVNDAGTLKKVATEEFVNLETTRATTAETTLQTNIAAETTRATTAETTLQTNIDTTNTTLSTETTNRIAADSGLDARITTVEGQVNGNIGNLTTLTTTDKSNLVAAINEVDAHADTNATNLATEITNRTSADNNLSTRIDNVTIASGIIGDVYTADPLTNYINMATSLTSADKLLDTQIKVNATNISTVDSRLTTVEGQVNGNIGDLTTLTTDAKGNLVVAINEVDANINAEVARATASETTLTANINQEIIDRAATDTSLGLRIDKINTSAGIINDTYTSNVSSNYLTTASSLVDADNKLDSKLKSTIDNYAATTGTTLIGYDGYVETNTNIVNPTIEITAGTLKAALDDIASSVNTKIHDIENRYVKGEVSVADASDMYTIAHNLNTVFVDVSVQVYDITELVWRFDLVIVEVIDNNNVKISLASGTSAQIRYVIQGY